MKRIIEWFTLIIIGAFLAFETLVTYFAQFGHDFVQGGTEPPSLQYGWLILFLKMIGLAVSLRTSLIMLIVGGVDLIYKVFFFHIHHLHQSFQTALSNSTLEIAYLALVIFYSFIRKTRGLERGKK